MFWATYLDENKEWELSYVSQEKLTEKCLNCSLFLSACLPLQHILHSQVDCQTVEMPVDQSGNPNDLSDITQPLT